ncbi:PREDICTED: sushi, von Willebrand factor type A, EGF and pentraxin domain-containing protein 1-like isoform X2 [Polistes dominula]|uniref:Sushi, von Willebrand factor type A, EGF and pentraxin domain-containing protein 1-like isoform X2 n=1 Tax=Polistes dominula TaxID=743375 RepID=A0ABM1I2D6_POLDO|nr:PREDICTED: sushi, von Willebrand factor type A, EGF and pentraxin domain-containing protein 1-like isoform X2 [Polistes dominula]
MRLLFRRKAWFKKSYTKLHNCSMSKTMLLSTQIRNTDEIDLTTTTTTTWNYAKEDYNNNQYLHNNLKNDSKMIRRKADLLPHLLKIHIDNLRNETNEVELVFLVDGSGSIGLHNFRSELNFVKKLLSEFTVEPLTTRVAIVTFGGKRNINRNVDQISTTGKDNHKCYLLNKQLNNISYTGGGTYTRGALFEALDILEKGRKKAKKVIFLITDGFSNGGDPRPIADHLKNAGVMIFTFGIRTGNIKELHDIASNPEYAHSYFLDSFAEFEALARRALHHDLKTGKYVPMAVNSDCDILCMNNEMYKVRESNCCDDIAICSCGVTTGHYACICPVGFFGSGFKGSCQPCPNGTYASGYISGDSTAICLPCPDVNHITVKVPATTVKDCICASGFTADGRKCEVITCPKFKVPENGYLVKANACSNVVNAACGIRCKIGFQLTGDSIRLCGKNGIWSGNEAQCSVKTCPALKAPQHGRVRCQNDDIYQDRLKENLTSYPIDTRCQFKCDLGYQLRGSKVRNCLPLSHWDGLETTCKPIKCEPLKQLANGMIFPKNCTGREKLSFTMNCTISCKKGYKLEGPRIRSCGGRAGVWSQRRTVNRCVDNTPPVITCPPSITIENLPSKNYAYVNWTIPEAIDNDNDSVVVWSKPHIVLPRKMKIGTRNIVYVAQDASRNKARCKFQVKVIDKEPPMVENCVDPPVIFTDRETGAINISWNEPGFYDNSKLLIRIEQSHKPEDNVFPIGKTQIVYNATDMYGNIANCVLNITVKDVCKNITVPSNKSTNSTTVCSEGYELVQETTYLGSANEDMQFKCNKENGTSNDYIMSDCLESEQLETVYVEGNIALEGDTKSFCNNSTNLRELTDRITEDLRSKLIDICNNDVECNLVSFDPECKDDNFTRKNLYSNLVRVRRDHKKDEDKLKRKRDKIEIKFKFIGKIIKENRDNPKKGLQQLREKIELMTRSGKLDLFNNKTNQEIAKLAFNLHVIFGEIQDLCEPGSLPRKHTCIKCPLGTFHDTSAKQCRPCPLGEYQDVNGSIQCKKCPKNTYTKRMRTKSLQDCISVCQPGYFSKRRHHGSVISIEPCMSCTFGFYQPKYGQNTCLPCPMNSTTQNRGSININECIDLNAIRNDICYTKPCLNDGQCLENEDEDFSCECRDYYIGTQCEIFQNPCKSSPCLNEGLCIANETNKEMPYYCSCKSSYTGTNCEIYIDECTHNPCQNDGKCVSTENDYACICKDGFEGSFCETSVNYCYPMPCEKGSICNAVNQTWYCSCTSGFLGRRCNLLPCDWLPCHENSICINIREKNATRNSYRCECPIGYTGRDCTHKINYCSSSPCRNGGQCKSISFNYTCTCPPTFTGNNCEIELTSDYVMHFTRSSTTDYVMMKGPIKNISELTITVWLQTLDTFNYGTVLSYATHEQDNAFTVTDYNGFVLYINGRAIVTDVKINDGYWHFLCITWENTNGSWNIFLDGIRKDTGTNLAKGLTIPANGSFIIGQEQDRMGGGFSESESFVGNITLLDIWDSVFTNDYIMHLYGTCEKYYGTLFTWSHILEHVYGNIMIINSQFCQGCPVPVAPFKGNVNTTEDLLEATYYCDPGYVLKFDGKEQKVLRRKCLKNSEWEGSDTPKCSKVRCGFPGYFPRGYINGWSYLFGDEIYYSCINGYELRGSVRRVCKSNGKWSGLPPICIGVTCKSLLAPEHGDIEYIIEENERDDITILQAGQQIEFKCDPGFRLVGEKYLTCLETGVWNHDNAVCIPYRCPPPAKIEHGYMRIITKEKEESLSLSQLKENITDDLFTRNYSYGDTIRYFCDSGYKFENINDSSNTFILQCSNDGLWSSYFPKCVLINCSWPKPIEEGKIFLKIDGNLSLEIPAIPTELYSMQHFHNQELKKNFIPKTEIFVICNTGYKLIGENIRICSNEGTWIPDNQNCEPRNCPISNHLISRLFNIDELYNVQYKTEQKVENDKNISNFYGNINFYIEGDIYGKRIIMTCQNSMTHSNVFTINEKLNITWICDETSRWKLVNFLQRDNKFIQIHDDSTNEICEEALCATLVNINNMNDYKNVTNIFTFACQQNYVLEGSETLTCHSNGTWSTMPICKHITCKNPQLPFNAVLKLNETDYNIGDMIRYECIPGYRIFGQSTIKCLPNGKWSKMRGKCSKISCGKPVVPPGVVIKGPSYLFKEQVVYICPNGKKIGTITCNSDGKWSDPPQCVNK